MPWVAESIEVAASMAERWIDSSALRGLVASLGGPSRGADPMELMDWSSRHLDTRAGGEREDSVPPSWPDAWIRAVAAAAGPLGLLSTDQPRTTAYDMSAVLGGTTRSNRLRTEFAAQLVSSGRDLGILTVLTADRSLSACERKATVDYTEWEHAFRCAQDEFGPFSLEAEVRGTTSAGKWVDLAVRSSRGMSVRLLVAPPIGTGRRPTTADAIEFALSRVPAAFRRRLLLITTATYVPYQFFATAAPVLTAGVERLELVGVETAFGGDLRVLAHRCAQEIHAAIHASLRLLATQRGAS
jgi:hypothetical protein